MVEVNQISSSVSRGNMDDSGAKSKKIDKSFEGKIVGFFGRAGAFLDACISLY